MTDRYQKIRDALAKKLTPGPWEVRDDRTDTVESAQGYPVCTVHWYPDERYGHGSRAAYIAACDPDTIRELLEERDALADIRGAIQAMREQAKIDEAVSILRTYNEWRRSPAHYLESVPMPAMGDPRKIGIAIDTVCDVLSRSDDWSRALRLADEAAESVICTEGHSTAAYHWVLTHEQIAADPFLEDCIAHLEWRGIARRFDAEDGVTVIFEEQP